MSSSSSLCGRSFLAFDSSLSRLACFSEDNRLKVWQLSSSSSSSSSSLSPSSLSLSLSHQCVAPNHLAVKYTCIAWCQSHKKRRRGLVGLGSASGAVVVWDLNRGEIAATLKPKDGHNASPVTDVALSSSGKVLWHSTADGHVFEWDIKTAQVTKSWKADKGGVRRIQIVTRNGEESHLLSGRCELKLFQLSTGKSVHKLTGHSDPIMDMRVTQDGMFAVTSAAGDRFVNVWSLDLEQPNELAVRVLVSDSYIGHLSVRYVTPGAEESDAKKKKKSTVTSSAKFDISGTSIDGGEISLWTFSLSDAKKKAKKNEPQKADGTISFPSPPQKSDPPLLACQFSSSNPSAVLVVSGLRLKPTVSIEEVVSEDGGIVPRYWMSRLASDPIPSSLRNEDGESGSTSVISKGSERSFKKGDDRSVTKSLGVSQDSSVASSTVQVFDTRSFLEKLDALEKRVSLVPQTSKDIRAPKAESLASAVEQALHSDDPSLLESCLQVSGASVIHATCQRLSPPYVLPFLKSLIRRLEGNPNRASRLIPWVRSLLHYQSAYMMSLTDIDKVLSQLHSLIQDRLSAYPHLLQLSGRLDIVLFHLSSREKGDPGHRDASDARVFVDGEGTLEEIVSEEEEEEKIEDEGEEEREGEGEFIFVTPENSDEEEEGEGKVMYETPDEEEGSERDASSESEEEDESDVSD